MTDSPRTVFWRDRALAAEAELAKPAPTPELLAHWKARATTAEAAIEVIFKAIAALRHVGYVESTRIKEAILSPTEEQEKWQPGKQYGHGQEPPE